MEERHQVRLERVLVEFDRLGVGRQIDYDRHHLYSIITHSTAIEGPTITCTENTAMFDDGFSPSGKPVVERLMNLGLKRAYEVAMGLAQTRTKLTLPLLKALSSLVMRNTGALHRTAGGEYDEARGDPRLQNVSAGRGDRSSLPWEKVEARTNDFVAWLNGRLEGMDSMAAPDIYDLSFDAHFRLVTIHPWPDGNGRVARLAMDLVQMAGGVAPTIVRSDHKVRYIESLRASQKAGMPRPFLDFMTDEMIDALARDIDEYEHDLSRDVPWETFDPSTESRSTPQVTPKSGDSSASSAIGC